MSCDASLNLNDAISVAAHPSSRGKGSLVVANNEIHAVRDVIKTNSSSQRRVGCGRVHRGSPTGASLRAC
jgi:L-asparaginase/Glu-tRNA(Gln) amidotransferase subunit D